MLEHFLLVLIEVELLENHMVALSQLAGRKSKRDLRPSGMVVNEMHNAMEAAVHGAVVILRVTKVRPAGALLILGHMDGVLHQLFNALVLEGGNGDDRNAQHLLHLVDTDGTAVFPHLIHHIERQHHGDAQLHELHGEVEIAFDVGGVHNIDDALRFFIQQKCPGHQLFAGVGRHGVNAGQVGDQGVLLAADGAVLAVNSDAGEVTHVLIGAGELVEKRGLAAVLITCQGKGEQRVIGQGLLIRLGVIDAALSQARVLGRIPAWLLLLLLLLRLVDILHIDFSRVVQAKRELIAVNPQLHGVTHGRKLHERHLSARNDAHIQKMLAQRTLAADCDNAGALTRDQFF